MSQHVEKLAVMFADICGSTSLYERLGDETARHLISGCLDTMMTQVTAQQGTLVKTIGDEIMCTFPDAAHALNAACAMQDAMENANDETAQPMHIRVGFHYGDVIREEGDVYGDTVNVAARIASITRARQILTSKAAAETLPPELREKTLQIMRAVLKGKEAQLEIFRVAWEPDDALSTRVGTPAQRKPQEPAAGELTLRYRDQSCTLDGQRKNAVLGRVEGCDIRVQGDFASRQHARVELRFGKFVLTDQSTNGTYVRFADGHTVRLAREELILHGSGAISLGQAWDESPMELVDFSIATA